MHQLEMSATSPSFYCQAVITSSQITTELLVINLDLDETFLSLQGISSLPVKGIKIGTW